MTNARVLIQLIKIILLCHAIAHGNLIWTSFKDSKASAAQLEVHDKVLNRMLDQYAGSGNAFYYTFYSS